MKRWIPLLSIFALIGLFWVALDLNREQQLLPIADKPMIPFSLSTLENPSTPATEAVFQSTVQLVHFWATWCPSCRKEHSVIKEMMAELSIPIIGVGYGEKAEDLKAFLDQYSNPYSLNIIDSERLLAFQWGVSGVPETFLIDKKGKIRYRFKGSLTKKTIEENLKPAILELQKDA